MKLNEPFNSVKSWLLNNTEVSEVDYFYYAKFFGCYLEEIK